MILKGFVLKKISVNVRVRLLWTKFHAIPISDGDIRGTKAENVAQGFIFSAKNIFFSMMWQIVFALLMNILSK